jgi:hypothetical protein
MVHRQTLLLYSLQGLGRFFPPCSRSAKEI